MLEVHVLRSVVSAEVTSREIDGQPMISYDVHLDCGHTAKAANLVLHPTAFYDCAECVTTATEYLETISK